MFYERYEYKVHMSSIEVWCWMQTGNESRPAGLAIFGQE